MSHKTTKTIKQESARTSRRPGAAAFFGDGAGGNTTVPLPPSSGYSLEESDGEEEEPPPGTEPLGVMQVFNCFTFEMSFASHLHLGKGGSCFLEADKCFTKSKYHPPMFIGRNVYRSKWELGHQNSSKLFISS